MAGCSPCTRIPSRRLRARGSARRNRNVRVHDLRHEVTSRLADKLQAHELAKATGHRDMRMVLRYYHPRTSDLAKKLG